MAILAGLCAAPALVVTDTEPAAADTASWLTDRCDWIADLPETLVGSFKGEAAMSGAGVVTIGGGAGLTMTSATAAGTGAAGGSAAGAFTGAGLVALPAATVLAGAAVGACAWAYENDTSDLIVAAGDEEQLAPVAPGTVDPEFIQLTPVQGAQCYNPNNPTDTNAPCFTVRGEKLGSAGWSRYTSWLPSFNDGLPSSRWPNEWFTGEFEYGDPDYNPYPSPNPDPVTFTWGLSCYGDPTCGIINPDPYVRLYDSTFSRVWFDVMLRDVWPEMMGHPWWGQQRELRGRTTCKTPGGSSTTFETWSAPYWDQNQGILAPASSMGYKPPVCPAGTAPTKVLVERVRVGILSPRPTDTLYEWNIPSNIASNATSLQCWVVGTTVCPIYDEDPENPSASLRLGGPAGVAYPKGTPTVTETLDPVRQTLLLEDPVTTTTAAPTTTAATSTTTTSTVPGSNNMGGPGTPGGVGDVDGTGGECWPDGWGWFNPLEWVLKPVKCALLWAFWDQDVANELGALLGGALGPWLDFLNDTIGSFSFTAATGPCISIGGQDICTSAVLDVEMPAAVGALFAAWIVVWTTFEVVGFFARMTEGT